MNASRLMFAPILIMGFSTAAGAGPCTDGIAQLEKQLSTRDAGSGPTAQSRSGAGATQGGTDGMAEMNAKVGGTATSPSDVRTQTSTGSTANQPTGAADPKLLSDKLAAAKTADAKGDKAGCTKALNEAKALIR